MWTSLCVLMCRVGQFSGTIARGSLSTASTLFTTLRSWPPHLTRGGLVPSLGFDVWGAERVFQAAGCFPLLVGKRNITEDRFFSQLMAYLESGFPQFVAMEARGHAVVIVGHSWRKSAVKPRSSSSYVWGQVDMLLTVDDNFLPYGSVPLEPGEEREGSRRTR